MSKQFHEVKLIASPEEVFHFFKDINELRMIQLRNDALVQRMMLEPPSINLN